MFVNSVAVHSQVDMDLRRLCNAQSVCRDCIQASPDCSWCADPVGCDCMKPVQMFMFLQRETVTMHCLMRKCLPMTSSNRVLVVSMLIMLCVCVCVILHALLCSVCV